MAAIIHPLTSCSKVRQLGTSPARAGLCPWSGDAACQTNRDAAAASRLLATRFAMVEPVDLGKRVCRDADDDAVLGTAMAGKCACLITGDRDLLDLKTYRGMPILPPQQFWKFEAERPD